MTNGMNKLEDYLILDQKTLFKMLCRLFKNNTAVIAQEQFILVRGDAPVMLLAHLDTVHKETVRHICESQNGVVLMSPQGIGGDDRCGVYSLVTLWKQSETKPWLLFTCDEEIGGKGAEFFCTQHTKNKLPKELDDLKMLIEIDRKGSKDAVYYDCANDDFEKYITSKGFETDYGSFSDISYIAPELGVAAVNLSSGYYNAHTLHEYINRKHLNSTIKKVLGIIEDVADPKFPKYEYIEAPIIPRSRGGGLCFHYPYNELWMEEACVDPKLLDKIPDDLKADYLDLLDYYDFDELEEYRRLYGDQAIHQLYDGLFEGYGGELNSDDDETGIEGDPVGYINKYYTK